MEWILTILISCSGMACTVIRNIDYANQIKCEIAAKQVIVVSGAADDSVTVVYCHPKNDS